MVVRGSGDISHLRKVVEIDATGKPLQLKIAALGPHFLINITPYVDMGQGLWAP